MGHFYNIPGPGSHAAKLLMEYNKHTGEMRQNAFCELIKRTDYVVLCCVTLSGAAEQPGRVGASPHFYKWGANFEIAPYFLCPEIFCRPFLEL